MDHTAAQATFVEILFGLNTLFAIYPKFREYLQERLRVSTAELVAMTKTIELKKDDAARVNRMSEFVTQHANQCLWLNDIFVSLAVGLSLLSALACVAILFWDLLNYFGKHAGWLILPLPTYFVASFCNYLYFRIRCARRVRRFKTFLDDFENPNIPPELGP